MTRWAPQQQTSELERESHRTGPHQPRPSYTWTQSCGWDQTVRACIDFSIIPNLPVIELRLREVN